MNLEFKVYELEPKTNIGLMLEKQGFKEFMIVGADDGIEHDYYRVHDTETGPLLIKGRTYKVLPLLYLNRT